MTGTAKPLIVIMGVSGSGKSTVGALLAEELSVSFIDADNLHPLTNLDKMAAGLALDDDDRWPWLDRVGQALADRESTGAVVACSALKRSYRDAIRRHCPSTRFVLLVGTRDTLAARLAQRENHFMPSALLDSQFTALESLGKDEFGFSVDIGPQADVIAAHIAALVRD
jgi:gluconokinase